MKKNKGYIASRIVIYLVMILFVFFFAFPIIWLAITSFKPRPEVLSTRLPSIWTWDSYKETFLYYNFKLYFINTIIVSISSTALVALVAVPAAYGFSKYPFWGSRKGLEAVPSSSKWEKYRRV